jgi:hypothetical protein
MSIALLVTGMALAFWIRPDRRLEPGARPFID